MLNVTYQNLLHDVALRMSALNGTNRIDINTTYDKVVLADTDFKSADWPFNSFRDAILMAMGEFAWAVADTPGHPWRQFLRAETVSLSTNSFLPTTSSANREIIGVFGAVFDVVDGTPLVKRPVDEVLRLRRETWRLVPVYFYSFDGMLIQHTRTNVRIECCHYSNTVELAAYNGNSQIPLPDPVRAGVVARAISIMIRDSAWEEQARVYRDLSNEALKAIRAGATELPTLATSV